jgi:hypothetical protein
METITLEIPESYLLHIAVTGKMGSGEVLDLMRIWAEKECVKHGLERKLRKLQVKNLKELNKRLKNTIGDELMGELDSAIKKTVKKLLD